MRISTILLFAIIGFIGIYYVFSQLGTPSPPHTPVDTTPPTIQSVSASSITETSAVITWVTGEPATSQVMYCESVSVCNYTPVDQTLVTNHSVTLSDLEPNTTYHYTVISKDANGNEVTSATEGELKTSAQVDTTPPLISEVNASNITESSATIEWTTDEEATSQVEYGTTADYGSTTPLDEELTTSHSVTLTSLEPDTTYHFMVKSTDASGNETMSETDQTFETSSSTPVGLQEGDSAPDFILQTIDAEELTLSDFQGKIVMVNFWFVGCQPCEIEMPYIQAVSESWSGDEELVVLAINRRQSTETVQVFIDSLALTFDVLLDPIGAAHALYNINKWPTTFFIDTEGIIQEIQVGSFDSQAEIESVLDSL